MKTMSEGEGNGLAGQCKPTPGSAHQTRRHDSIPPLSETFPAFPLSFSILYMVPSISCPWDFTISVKPNLTLMVFQDGLKDSIVIY